MAMDARAVGRRAPTWMQGARGGPIRPRRVGAAIARARFGLLALLLVAGAVALLVGVARRDPVYPVARVAAGWLRDPAAWSNRDLAVRGTIVSWTLERSPLIRRRAAALPAAVSVADAMIPAGSIAWVALAPDGTSEDTADGKPVLFLLVRLRPQPLAPLTSALRGDAALRRFVPAALRPGVSSVYRVRLEPMCSNQADSSCVSFYCPCAGVVLVS